MIFKNGKVFTNLHDKFSFYDANIYVKDQYIDNIEPSSSTKKYGDENIVDCSDTYIIPGLTDVHFHGCAGSDFCDGNFEALKNIARYQARHGITQICPATMTYTEEILLPVMKNAANFNDKEGADLVGINMEGPFISTEKIGAQNPAYVQKPNFEMIERLQAAANGLIKLIDVAPEVEGALDFIKRASKDYVISIAHTNTDYQTAVKAFNLGAKHLTHLYNAMPGIHHRNPGPITAGSENNAMAEIICDGHHVSYPAIRLAFKMFGPNNIVLISDSCEATGMPDGKYSLGGQEILQLGGKAVLAETPDTIAASTTNLFDCMKHAIFDCKIPQNDAILSATLNPAKSIGIDNLYGSLQTGKFASFLILDKDFSIKDIYIRGNKLKL